jgi:AsmA protein
MSCRKIQLNKYSGSELKITAVAKQGLIDLRPITLNLFAGNGSGGVRVDNTGITPSYHIDFSLPQFRIEDPLKAQTPKTVLSGPMSFSMNLSFQGKSAQQMKQSVSGDAMLEGKNLKLHGHDLDLEFSRYESSQSFNLLDMGAMLVAGPVGLAVTKGRDFASVLAGSGGVSDIRTIISRWKVKRGVMHAQDVAMATNKHRVAFLGAIDMAHEHFINVTLALINSKGCAVVQQKINGPFEKPVVQQPSIIKSVAGPVLKLLKKGKKLLSGDECQVIYTGSVLAPP